MNQYKERSSGRRKKQNSSFTFQELAKRINFYLRQEGIRLTFQGYTDTVSRYSQLQEHDLYEVYQLMTQCNLWSNYLSEIENLIQLKSLEAQVELDRLKAYYKKKTKNESLEQAIKKAKTKAKEFHLFYHQLIAQKTFFENAFWHCLKIYEQGTNTLHYKTLH
jgi:MarR-like DNA-binding transcriptional regulator SgrR of sgrS sRNA